MTPAAATLAETTISCPLCHTEAPALTDRALAAGGDWRCPQCHQMWNEGRLATVAAYAHYCLERTRPRVH